jgi:phage terminase large subunit-like protein
MQELVRQTDAAMMDLGSLDKDVKNARQLIADITRSGTKIYDGLSKEQGFKEARQMAITKQTDKADVGHAIQVVL